MINPKKTPQICHTGVQLFAAERFLAIERLGRHIGLVYPHFSCR